MNPLRIKAFDNDSYLAEQSEAILQRAAEFDDKLYIEFGGKLGLDGHAARVLPGYDPDVKLKLLQKLKDKAEIVICVHAGAIEQRKVRADLGIGYDDDTMRIIDHLKSWGLMVNSVVVTRYNDQKAVQSFMTRLSRRGLSVYAHRAIQGYPTDVDTIVSDAGYGANAYIETTRPIVIVTGPGPSSGKMGTCLSQVYHEHKRGVQAGYAKFETFPIWNLPLKHPVNIAYEAATADIGDKNMVDPFHLEATGEVATNYNRDVEIFPVVRRICAKIMSPDRLYRSPTDMGVNRAGFAITDDAAVREAAIQEIIRRYFRYNSDYARGMTDTATLERIKLLMDEVDVKETARRVVLPAREAAVAAAKTAGKGNNNVFCGAALELADGTIITGKNSPILHAASSCVLNAIKHLARLPDELYLIAPDVIDSVGKLKKEVLKSRRISLDLSETLVALAVSMPSNPSARLAMKKLSELADCEMHLSHIPTPGDEAGLRKLGINLTSDANYAGSDLFVD